MGVKEGESLCDYKSISLTGRVCVCKMTVHVIFYICLVNSWQEQKSSWAHLNDSWLAIIEKIVKKKNNVQGVENCMHVNIWLSLTSHI